MDSKPAAAPPEEPLGSGNRVTDKAVETYKWWNNLATINAEDPFLVGAAKIGIRLLGIIVLLALSPLIIAGLVIAFITVL